MKNWSIGKRIIIGYAAILTAMIALGAFSLSRLNLIGRDSDSVVKSNMPAVILLGTLQGNMREAYSAISNHILSTDQSRIATIEKTLRATIVESDELLKTYQDKMVDTDKDRELITADLRGRDAFNQSLEEVLALSRANKNTEAYDLFVKKSEPAFTAFDGAVQTHIDHDIADAKTSGENITSAISSSRSFTIFGIGVALLLAGGIGFVIITTTNRALTSTALALGDGAAQVTAAAGQVSSASQALAEGSSEQAASLEETSASLEEMSAMTKRNADSALQAKDLSNQTRAAADTGASHMENMRRAMDDITASSNDIAKIIKTIDEIAFQTNILALNAAVEAARAGEAGMGFAVVAEEVRSLAQRSAESAKETASKIETAIQKSEHGVRISSSVAASLSEIVDKARKVDAFVAEIAQASQEQNQGIVQVNSAIGQMDKVTQSNASSAEETAAAAEELNSQAQSMQEAVAGLRQLVTGVRSTHYGATPPPAYHPPTAPRHPGVEIHAGREA